MHVMNRSSSWSMSLKMKENIFKNQARSRRSSQFKVKMSIVTSLVLTFKGSVRSSEKVRKVACSSIKLLLLNPLRWSESQAPLFPAQLERSGIAHWWHWKLVISRVTILEIFLGFMMWYDLPSAENCDVILLRYVEPTVFVSDCIRNLKEDCSKRCR